MIKEELKEMIDNGFSIRKIQKESGKSNGTVRYWLKKYELKTKNNPFNKKSTDDFKYCSKCETTKSVIDFYKRSSKGRKHDTGGYCKKCSNKYHQARVIKVKIKMVNYKGGECERCNLKLIDSNYTVFDFHHINPDEKDPNFNHIKFQKWEMIKKEIDKCMLVCSNCHRTIHYEMNKKRIEKEIADVV